MEATEFESDALLKLLTDALRRGPGSPEWHDALERLRSSGVKGADELRLLVTVRERLEAGQDYRKISAGPAFTSELFDKINNGDAAAPARRPWVPLAVASLCLVLVIVSAGVLTKYLSTKPDRDPAIDRLSNQLFVNPALRLTFDKPGPTSLAQTGDLKIDTNGGLRIGFVPPKDNPPATGTALLKHGGILNLASGTCVEADIRVNRPGDAAVGIVLWPGEMDDPTPLFRFAFSLDANGFTVAHAGKTDRVARSIQPGNYTLRLKIAGDVAIAEVGGREIWSGRHDLGTTTAHLGIQFDKTGKSTGDIRVMSLQELKP